MKVPNMRLFFLLATSISTFTLNAQKSLDDIERESFEAQISPFSSLGQPMSSISKFCEPATFPICLSLNGEWMMVEGKGNHMQVNSDWKDGIIAKIPGSIHSALWEKGIIPNPYIGQNDSIAEKQSYKTWWLKKEFTIENRLIDPVLSFEGIANKCTIWLNGACLGKHEGMFGGPDFPVKKYLKEKNVLIVKLEPIPQMFLRNWPPNANESWKYTVVFNCVYGWHYAQIPSLGIWRSVKLRDRASIEIKDPFISTRSTNGDMRLAVNLKQIYSQGKGVLHAKITPANFKGDSLFLDFHVKPFKGEQSLLLDFKIDNPQLWWPNDMGAQPLYKLDIIFTPEQGIPDKKSVLFGIRTIEMASAPNGPKEDKYNWTFVINGKPMFVKGTGWCTMDPLMDFSRSKYDHLLKIAKNQHIQILRAWGGGMPETDDFYELCDTYGIMVIQEWPTAWNSHETQPYAILQETVERNTKRLRNHPSLVMWGAGNESDKPFGPAIDMMGKLSIELDGSRPFHRGEAWGGSDHNYNCWWDNAHLNHNLNMTSPFWGEFGIASLPHMETIEKYMEDEIDIWPPQKGGNFIHHTPIFGTMGEFDKLTQYSGYFMPNETLEDFTTGSQLAQIVAVRHTLERARSRWPSSSGALYYKMNDNYPAVSWSCVDFYGAIKPIHYFVQKSFSPLAAVILFDRTNLSSQEVSLPVFLLDDYSSLKGSDFQVRTAVLNERLDTVAQHFFNGSGDQKSVHKLGHIDLDRSQTKSSILFFVVDIIVNGSSIYRNFYITNYEVRQGSIMSAPKAEIKMIRSGNQVTLTNIGKLPAIGVYIESPGNMDKLIVSDNYLWINPQESKTVEVNIPTPIIVKGWNLK